MLWLPTPERINFMNKENISFEAALKRLEEIANLLENNNTTLDESMALFEEGIKLSKKCSDILGNAKQKIITLTEAESEEGTND